MKTIYILAAFLGLQFNTIFAAENFRELPATSNEVLTIGTSAMLMPVTPLEATFEDIAETNLSDLNLLALTPVTPMIADFSDEPPVTEMSVINLSPVTPKEADFEDLTGIDLMSSMRNLSPVTPVEASFEELEHA